MFQVVNNELRHQQSVLEGKANSALTARRLSASAANTRDLLIRHEQDNMQAISQKCKDFLDAGIAGQEVVSRTSIECANTEDSSIIIMNSPIHQTSSPQTSSDDSLATGSGSSSTDQEKSSSSGFSGDLGSSSDLDNVVKHQRERRVGVVHNMDVHLDFHSSEHDCNGVFRGRKEQRTRRVGGNNNKWESLSQPKYPVRSNRELDIKFQEEMMKSATEEDGNLKGSGRRKSLPVILGRSMTRHDRKDSKSRDNLLLPDVGRNRSVSPDVRIRVKYANDEDDNVGRAISEVPFGQRQSPRQIQRLRSQQSYPGGLSADSRSGSVSPRQAAPRLEIDLSLPVASMVASPRPSTKAAK